MSNLENKIIEFYKGQTLSEAQYRKLTRSSTPRPLWSAPLRYAAVAMLVIGVAGVFWAYQSYQQRQHWQAYAQEVAFNHLKGLDSDFQTSNIAELNQKMPKLNFELSLPASIQSNYELLGGRYCSIDNRMASQLKLKNQRDEIVTLYVLKSEPKEQVDRQLWVDSTYIQLWNEDAALYVLASRHEIPAPGN